jgi:hypothetical protein
MGLWLPEPLVALKQIRRRAQIARRPFADQASHDDDRSRHGACSEGRNGEIDISRAILGLASANFRVQSPKLSPVNRRGT